MELLYLWVEKYNNIEKQGFNFSSKYKFDFDYDKQELKCEENTNSVEEGFFGENITNITAIIGKNGSGKSSVLELLKILITNKSIKEKCVIIFKESNNGKTILWANIDNEIFKKIAENYNNIEFIKNKQRTTDDFNFPKEFETLGGIFYSNVFDYKNEMYYEINNNKEKMINISTNYLLKDYSKNYTQLEKMQFELNDLLEKLQNLKKEKENYIIESNLKEDIDKIREQYLGKPQIEVQLINLYKRREL